MNAKRKSIASDLKRVSKLKERDIDYSDIPELDDSFYKREVVKIPQKKDSITLRIDHEVLQYFKNHGKGYQTLMNAVLKTYVDAHQKQRKRK